MGCGSRAGKKDQHANGKPTIDAEACRGCKQCLRECANDGLSFDEASLKMTVNADNCVGADVVSEHVTSMRSVLRTVRRRKY